MKKKIFSLLLTLVILLTFSACGATDEQKSEGGINDGMNGGMNAAPAPAPSEDSDYESLEDRFDTFVENEFIKTEIENVSTFSSDVDTASYAYFRKLVQSGYSLSELIATAGHSIRTEEMINYFDYGYQNPKDGELFSTAMQIAPCPWNDNAVLMTLGLQTKKVEIGTKNNLVFLIDVSGSMNSRDKLELLKESFSHLVDKLDGDDTVSIVTYASGEEIVLEGCSGNKKDMILKAIYKLSANGATNGEAGLKMAYRLAESYFIKDGNNRIILASDGDLNVGMSSTEEIKNFVSQKKESGVFLSVLGFGTGNYKDSMMETIADCGNGVYYYIDSAFEAEKIFGEDLFATLYTVAKDVKLQLTFDPSSIDSYRLVGYENRVLANEDFEDDTKDAGEMGAGHSLTVCYELILTEKASNAQEPWMVLGVRYKEPTEEKSKEETYAFGKEVYTDTPSENFKFITAVTQTSMILHKSKYIGNVTLADVLKTLKTLDFSEDACKVQFKQLIQTLVK